MGLLVFLYILLALLAFGLISILAIKAGNEPEPEIVWVAAFFAAIWPVTLWLYYDTKKEQKRKDDG